MQGITKMPTRRHNQQIPAARNLPLAVKNLQSLKKPKTETNNYRLIYLIPTFLKVIEQIVLERLLTHLELNSLLTSQQHEFLKVYSNNKVSRAHN